jgi:uroporphyrinogen III methyltransferase/synthase
MNHSGIVYLVGAGPGDPELISIKGVKCLQNADVVIYDRLVSGDLLSYAPPWAELIYMGKEPDSGQAVQQEIYHLMLERASEGKTVVRLKGGDPFVFGRGGEECQMLAAAGIPYEVIPGITSAIAAPAYAGIPLTHRKMAQSFTVVTGHTCGHQPCSINWDDLPRSGTLVILMGIQNLAQIALRLMQHGRAGSTPAAVIQWGTIDAQAVVTGKLADIAEKAVGIRPPAVIVVGEVVDLHQQIGWFKPEVYHVYSNPIILQSPEADADLVPGKPGAAFPAV